MKSFFNRKQDSQPRPSKPSTRESYKFWVSQPKNDSEDDRPKVVAERLDQPSAGDALKSTDRHASRAIRRQPPAVDENTRLPPLPPPTAHSHRGLDRPAEPSPHAYPQLGAIASASTYPGRPSQRAQYPGPEEPFAPTSRPDMARSVSRAQSTPVNQSVDQQRGYSTDYAAQQADKPSARLKLKESTYLRSRNRTTEDNQSRMVKPDEDTKREKDRGWLKFGRDRDKTRTTQTKDKERERESDREYERKERGYERGVAEPDREREGREQHPKERTSEERTRKDAESWDRYHAQQSKLDVRDPVKRREDSERERQRQEKEVKEKERQERRKERDDLHRRTKEQEVEQRRKRDREERERRSKELEQEQERQRKEEYERKQKLEAAQEQERKRKEREDYERRKLLEDQERRRQEKEDQERKQKEFEELERRRLEKEDQERKRLELEEQDRQRLEREDQDRRQKEQEEQERWRRERDESERRQKELEQQQERRRREREELEKKQREIREEYERRKKEQEQDYERRRKEREENERKQKEELERRRREREEQDRLRRELAQEQERERRKKEKEESERKQRELEQEQQMEQERLRREEEYERRRKEFEREQALRKEREEVERRRKEKEEQELKERERRKKEDQERKQREWQLQLEERSRKEAEESDRRAREAIAELHRLQREQEEQEDKRRKERVEHERREKEMEQRRLAVEQEEKRRVESEERERKEREAAVAETQRRQREEQEDRRRKEREETERRAREAALEQWRQKEEQEEKRLKEKEEQERKEKEIALELQRRQRDEQEEKRQNAERAERERWERELVEIQRRQMEAQEEKRRAEREERERRERESAAEVQRRLREEQEEKRRREQLEIERREKEELQRRQREEHEEKRRKERELRERKEMEAALELRRRQVAEQEEQARKEREAALELQRRQWEEQEARRRKEAVEHERKEREAAFELQRRQAAEQEEKLRKEKEKEKEEHERREREAALEFQRRALVEQEEKRRKDKEEQEQREALELQRRQWEELEEKRKKEKEDNERREKEAALEAQRRQIAEQEEKRRREKDERDRREREEHQRRQWEEQEEKRRKEKEENDRKEREAAFELQRRQMAEQEETRRRDKEDKERREREDQQRRLWEEQEEKSRKEKEENDRKEREALEQHRRQVAELEERRQREKDDQERREREEQEVRRRADKEEQDRKQREAVLEFHRRQMADQEERRQREKEDNERREKEVALQLQRRQVAEQDERRRKEKEERDRMEKEAALDLQRRQAAEQEERRRKEREEHERREREEVERKDKETALQLQWEEQEVRRKRDNEERERLEREVNERRRQREEEIQKRDEDEARRKVEAVLAAQKQREREEREKWTADEQDNKVLDRTTRRREVQEAPSDHEFKQREMQQEWERRRRESQIQRDIERRYLEDVAGQGRPRLELLKGRAQNQDDFSDGERKVGRLQEELQRRRDSVGKGQELEMDHQQQRELHGEKEEHEHQRHQPRQLEDAQRQMQHQRDMEQERRLQVETERELQLRREQELEQQRREQERQHAQQRQEMERLKRLEQQEHIKRMEAEKEQERQRQRELEQAEQYRQQQERELLRDQERRQVEAERQRQIELDHRRQLEEQHREQAKQARSVKEAEQRQAMGRERQRQSQQDHDLQRQRQFEGEHDQHRLKHSVSERRLKDDEGERQRREKDAETRRRKRKEKQAELDKIRRDKERKEKELTERTERVDSDRERPGPREPEKPAVLASFKETPSLGNETEVRGLKVETIKVSAMSIPHPTTTSSHVMPVPPIIHTAPSTEAYSYQLPNYHGKMEPTEKSNQLLVPPTSFGQHDIIPSQHALSAETQFPVDYHKEESHLRTGVQTMVLGNTISDPSQLLKGDTIGLRMLPSQNSSSQSLSRSQQAFSGPASYNSHHTTGLANLKSSSNGDVVNTGESLAKHSFADLRYFGDSKPSNSSRESLEPRKRRLSTAAASAAIHLATTRSSPNNPTLSIAFNPSVKVANQTQTYSRTTRNAPAEPELPNTPNSYPVTTSEAPRTANDIAKDQQQPQTQPSGVYRRVVQDSYGKWDPSENRRSQLPSVPGTSRLEAIPLPVNGTSDTRRRQSIIQHQNAFDAPTQEQRRPSFDLTVPVTQEAMSSQQSREQFGEHNPYVIPPQIASPFTPMSKNINSSGAQGNWRRQVTIDATVDPSSHQSLQNADDRSKPSYALPAVANHTLRSNGESSSHGPFIAQGNPYALDLPQTDLHMTGRNGATPNNQRFAEHTGGTRGPDPAINFVGDGFEKPNNRPAYEPPIFATPLVRGQGLPSVQSSKPSARHWHAQPPTLDGDAKTVESTHATAAVGGNPHKEPSIPDPSPYTLHSAAYRVPSAQLPTQQHVDGKHVLAGTQNIATPERSSTLPHAMETVSKPTEPSSFNDHAVLSTSRALQLGEQAVPTTGAREALSTKPSAVERSSSSQANRRRSYIVTEQIPDNREKVPRNKAYETPLVTTKRLDTPSNESAERVGVPPQPPGEPFPPAQAQYSSSRTTSQYLYLSGQPPPSVRPPVALLPSVSANAPFNEVISDNVPFAPSVYASARPAMVPLPGSSTRQATERGRRNDTPPTFDEPSKIPPIVARERQSDHRQPPPTMIPRSTRPTMLELPSLAPAVEQLARHAQPDPELKWNSQARPDYRFPPSQPSVIPGSVRPSLLQLPPVRDSQDNGSKSNTTAETAPTSAPATVQRHQLPSYPSLHQLNQHQGEAQVKSSSASRNLESAPTRHKYSSSMPTAIPPTALAELSRVSRAFNSRTTTAQVPSSTRVPPIQLPSRSYETVHQTTGEADETILLTPSSLAAQSMLPSISQQSFSRSVIPIREGQAPAVNTSHPKSSPKLVVSTPPAIATEPRTSQPEIWRPRITDDREPQQSSRPSRRHESRAPNEQPRSVPIHQSGRRQKPVFNPFHYLGSGIRKRTMSMASLEARDGTAASTVVGSPSASICSTAPFQLPPIQDPLAAAEEWRNREEAIFHESTRNRRPRPGVVVPVAEDSDEDNKKTRRPKRLPNRRRSSTRPPPAPHDSTTR